MRCLVLLVLHCLLLSIRNCRPAAASPLSIPSTAPVASHTVDYKAFSDSWVVLLPGVQGLYGTDLVLAQLCYASASCTSVNNAATIGNCSLLASFTNELGWFNARLPPHTAPGTREDMLLCEELEASTERDALQGALQDVCIEPCAHILQPLGLEVLGRALETLQDFDRDPAPDVLLLRARLVVVTVVGSTQGASTVDGSGVFFAVSSHVFEARLRRPDMSTHGVTLILEHECSRRGLQAPALATMDLFLGDSGALVCNWDCRADHLRTQWNLEPLPKNTTQEERDSMRHLCWPLPQRFVAVFFSVHVGTPVRAPHAALLPAMFYDNLNVLADEIQAEHFPDGMVLLNMPRSNFDNFKFSTLLQQAVRFRGAEGQYEILQVGLTDVDSLASVAARRLLELSPAQGVLLVEGVVVTPLIASTPQQYVRKVRDALTVPPTRLPPAISAVGTSAVREIHRLADSVMVPVDVTPPNASDSDGVRSLRRAGYAGLELMLIVVFCAGFGLCFAAGRRPKRRGETRNLDI